MRPPTVQYSSGREGFSLVEITLALGIISFALIGILGLFPVALDAAANSERETQATLIARSIFEQLSVGSETDIRTINLAPTLDGPTSRPIQVDLTKSGSLGPLGFDAGGNPLTSASDANIAYRAQISVTPMPAPTHGLTQVVVTVHAVVSPKANYPFASLLVQK